MNERADQVLAELLLGNNRFRSGAGAIRTGMATIAQLAKGRAPVAVVVGCADSRVTPEIVFDQPLGRLLVSRSPGGVADEGAKWTVELAIEEHGVPLVVVLGHTNCLAVGQVLEGHAMGAGGMLRVQISAAVSRARSLRPADLHREAAVQNAIETTQRLFNEVHALRSAVQAGRVGVATMLYDLETGEASCVNVGP